MKKILAKTRKSLLKGLDEEQAYYVNEVIDDINANALNCYFELHNIPVTDSGKMRRAALFYVVASLSIMKCGREFRVTEVCDEVLIPVLGIDKRLAVYVYRTLSRQNNEWGGHKVTAWCNMGLEHIYID